MNKQTLIEKLQDKQILAAENTQLLNTAITTNQVQFDEFNDLYLPLKESHYWDSIYFENQASELKNNFSKERCEHLIKVKEKLQNIGERGFIRNPIFTAETTTSNSPPLGSEQKISTKYTPSKELLNHLQTGNLSRVRTELKIYLNDMNLSPDSLNDSFLYILQNHPEVYEEHRVYSIAKDIDKNKDSWDWDYFNLQQVYLNRNFSWERIEHLRKVRTILAAEGIEEFQPISRTSISQNDQQTQSSHNFQALHDDAPNDESANDNHFLKVALMVGGAVLAALALIISISR